MSHPFPAQVSLPGCTLSSAHKLRIYNDLAKEFAEGKLKAKEHTVRGIEKFPAALMMLFNGDNVGKLVLEVGGD